MLFKTQNINRPYHLSSYPFEILQRDPGITAREAASPTVQSHSPKETELPLAAIARKYARLYLEERSSEAALGLAAVPDDLEQRSTDVKGYGLFLDAAHVGITRVPGSAWYPGNEQSGQDHAVVIVVENARMPEPDDPAYGWLDGAEEEISLMRGAEIAHCIALYLASLGYNSTIHTRYESGIDLDKLASLSGVLARNGSGIVSPWLGDDMTWAVVTTAYPMAIDQPLASGKRADRGLKYWLGINGAMSGRERRHRTKRPLHMSRFPIEQLRRQDRPTTLIIDDEVPRVPKRADGFTRASYGDFGKKASAVGITGMTKAPHNVAMMMAMHNLIPFQGGEVAEAIHTDCRDPAANARAIKSLAYHLGADQVGICKIPKYAWYSHKEDGTPLKPYNKYAVCILIDQGYETMEGASGDDYISAAQSMRAYLRGAEIGCVMGDFIRGLGYNSRSQTAADGDVLQIPLLLWAGLGELSRIGELVLNPFVGPRFKSLIITTDIPMEVDKPVDFGLQYFCSNCYKCSRECPCNAMPFGPKVMFNGYEIWKPDVERCTTYRVTNPKGSMCGRCMKMCPLNKVPGVDGPLAHRIGSWLGINAMWLKPLLVPIAVYLDDRLGYGTRNPKKKWWLDIELVNGVGQVPSKGVSARDLSLDKQTPPDKHVVAYYPASSMPPPDCDGAFPTDRKAAVALGEQLETPEEARVRVARGEVKPLIYVPTPPLNPDALVDEE